MKKKEAEGCLWLLIVGVPIYGAIKVFDAVGFVLPIVVIIISVVAICFYRLEQRKKRLAYLRAKYQDEEVVQNIINEVCWQGETAEQLIDSIGRPIAIDNKVLKTKKKEIWKYNQTGENRFRLRITLENDIVVGWEQKS